VKTLTRSEVRAKRRPERPQRSDKFCDKRSGSMNGGCWGLQSAARAQPARARAARNPPAAALHPSARPL